MNCSKPRCSGIMEDTVNLIVNLGQGGAYVVIPCSCEFASTTIRSWFHMREAAMGRGNYSDKEREDARELLEKGTYAANMPVEDKVYEEGDETFCASAFAWKEVSGMYIRRLNTVEEAEQEMVRIRLEAMKLQLKDLKKDHEFDQDEEDGQ